MIVEANTPVDKKKVISKEKLDKLKKFLPEQSDLWDESDWNQVYDYCKLPRQNKDLRT